MRHEFRFQQIKEEIQIVDSHTHMGPGFASQPAMFPGIHATDILKLMDSADIEIACNFPPAWQGPVFQNPTSEISNAAIARETADHRSRLLPFARVNPNYPDQALQDRVRLRRT